MRDHKFTIPIGGSVQREGQFDFLRIVDCDGVLSLEFPTDQKELSEFAKGDYLGFRNPQREFIAQNRTDAELTVWIKTSAEATMQSGLLVGDVNIVGVNQDANDEPLFVRTSRGLDTANISEKVLDASLGTAPIPGTSILKYLGGTTVIGFHKYSYIHVTNNSMIPQGAGQQIADRRIAIVPNNANLKPIRWIEEGETVVLPVIPYISFAGLVTQADHNNGALGYVTMTGELK